MKFEDVKILEFDHIYDDEYPKYCAAVVSRALNLKTDLLLTDEELIAFHWEYEQELLPLIDEEARDRSIRRMELREERGHFYGG